jgi:hypothetical protein
MSVSAIWKRRIEVLHDGNWETVDSLSKVKKGETFRMFEPEGGEPVVVIPSSGRSQFVATKDGFIDPASGVGSVYVEIYPDEEEVING